jgi:hypothetical protein
MNATLEAVIGSVRARSRGLVYENTGRLTREGKAFVRAIVRGERCSRRGCGHLLEEHMKKKGGSGPRRGLCVSRDCLSGTGFCDCDSFVVAGESA